MTRIIRKAEDSLTNKISSKISNNILYEQMHIRPHSCTLNPMQYREKQQLHVYMQFKLELKNSTIFIYYLS